MMSEKKSIRAGLLIAAALVLLFVALKSPKRAEQMEHDDDIIVSREDSFCAGDLVLELSDAGGYPIYYTLDGSIHAHGKHPHRQTFPQNQNRRC